jgi:hypothetical protein
MKVCATDTAIYGCKLSVLRAPLRPVKPLRPGLGEGAFVQMQVRQPGLRRHRCAVDHRRQAPLHPPVSSSPLCASLAVPTPAKPRVVSIPAWAIRPPRSTASGPPLHRRSLRSAEYQYRRCSRIFRDGGMKITGGAAKIRRRARLAESSPTRKPPLSALKPLAAAAVQ